MACENEALRGIVNSALVILLIFFFFMLNSIFMF